MNFFDKLVFLGRRYERQRAPRSGSTRFTLGDILQEFNYNTILELTPVAKGKPGVMVQPDPVRKLKVSLLDHGISAIHSHNEDWFEVYRTAPHGDLSKVRILAHSPREEKIGEIHMLVSQRMPEFYFAEDPIFEKIGRNF